MVGEDVGGDGSIDKHFPAKQKSIKMYSKIEKKYKDVLSVQM